MRICTWISNPRRSTGSWRTIRDRCGLHSPTSLAHHCRGRDRGDVGDRYTPEPWRYCPAELVGPWGRIRNVVVGGGNGAIFGWAALHYRSLCAFLYGPNPGGQRCLCTARLRLLWEMRRPARGNLHSYARGDARVSRSRYQQPFAFAVPRPGTAQRPAVRDDCLSSVAAAPVGSRVEIFSAGGHLSGISAIRYRAHLCRIGNDGTAAPRGGPLQRGGVRQPAGFARIDPRADRFRF